MSVWSVLLGTSTLASTLIRTCIEGTAQISPAGTALDLLPSPGLTGKFGSPPAGAPRKFLCLYFPFVGLCFKVLAVAPGYGPSRFIWQTLFGETALFSSVFSGVMFLGPWKISASSSHHATRFFCEAEGIEDSLDGALAVAIGMDDWASEVVHWHITYQLLKVRREFFIAHGTKKDSILTWCSRLCWRPPVCPTISAPSRKQPHGGPM